jgi:hypothetical protein
MSEINRFPNYIDFRVGSAAMLIAASVMINGSERPGTSMMKQWLIRRSVRIGSAMLALPDGLLGNESRRETP